MFILHIIEMSNSIESPIEFIPGVIFNRWETIEKCMNFGLYKSAVEAKCDFNNVVQYIIIRNYSEKLPNNLLAALGKFDLKEFGKDQQGRGQDPDGTPSTTNSEFLELKQVILSDRNLTEIAIVYFNLLGVYTKLSLVYQKELIDRVMVEGALLFDEFEGGPTFLCKLETLIGFRDGEKNQVELEQFGLCLSIRSWVGTRKNPKPITYDNMLARMFGFESAEQVSLEDMDDNVMGLYSKLYPTEGVSSANCINRLRRRKLLKNTCKNWNIRVGRKNGVRGKKLMFKKDI